MCYSITSPLIIYSFPSSIINTRVVMLFINLTVAMYMLLSINDEYSITSEMYLMRLEFNV